MIGAKKRFKVLERDKFRCQYCGKNGKDVSLEVDHIIPKSKGGTDELGNLITCCRECNIGKGNEIIGDKKGIIKMIIQDTEKEVISDFFEWRNEEQLGTIDSKNVAFVSGLIKSYFNWDIVVGYVESQLVGKIGKATSKGKLEKKDFYEGGDDCKLSLNEWRTFVWENDICDLIYCTKEDKNYLGTWHNINDNNERLNYLISRIITYNGEPMSLLYKYSLFPNMVEKWQKEKAELQMGL